jgi:cytidine deaminase
MDYNELFNQAKEALKMSYSPYSNFKVGAALLMKDGKIVKGTNVENASYGLSNCAERSALFSAYTQGYRKDDILALAVTSTSTPPASPCGACRQVISELMNEDAPVFIFNDKNERYEVKVKELLPFAFNKEQL